MPLFVTNIWFVCCSALVDSTSESRFKLSEKGRKIRRLVIFCDSGWASWLHILPLFQDGGCADLKVSVYTLDKSMMNFFGVNRSSSITWHRFNVSRSCSSAFASTVGAAVSASDLVLFSGGLDGLRQVVDLCHPASIPLIACVHGNQRLRRLSSFSLSWERVGHSTVGGATNLVTWVGFSGSFLVSRDPGPTYCPSAMRDLLEFAPKGVFTTDHAPSPVSVPHRLPSAILHSDLPHVWLAHGLCPAEALSPLAPLCQDAQVLAPTPFCPSGWGLRSFTATEIGRFFDLPVACEKRLTKAHPGSLPFDHPLRRAFPVKVITHALWLCGYCSCVRGDALTNPHTTTNPTLGGGMVSQADFNPVETKVDVKAVKHDDAAVPIHIWNQRLIYNYPVPERLEGVSKEAIERSLDTLRKFLVVKWCALVFTSLNSYLKITWPKQMEQYQKNERRAEKLGKEFLADIDGGRECLGYATSASWWEWLGGSRLFFWRWTDEFRRWARDGIPVCWLKDIKLKKCRPQPPVRDKEVKKHMTKKIDKIRTRGYVKPGRVKSLIKFFAVPKGKSDIRMVYDGTASGFNDSVWVPNFGLPTVDTLLRGTGPNTWMVDLDIGEMFLNFMLDEHSRELVGVDITQFFTEEMTEDQKTLWERWVRCAMGLKVSPNHAIRALLFAEEFLLGHPAGIENPFHYESVRLNLPGSANYQPSEPWFSLRRHDEMLATILATFVDDERIHAGSEELAWESAHQLATREAYLGIQDAARKRRAPSQQAGAWAGSIVRTNNESVGLMVSEERWAKTKKIIGKWLDLVSKNPKGGLDTKELLSDRGFLIYITRTYRELIPYLKGLHLTIDGWRDNRDDDGWRMATAYSRGKNFGENQEERLPRDFPETVVPVPRLLGDLKALAELTKEPLAPIVLVQSKNIFIVRYGFGDASGGGFGSSIMDPVNGLEIQIGTWNEKGSENSSNFREFGNFVIRLEKEAREGKLRGAEVFMFTDNATTEAAYHNGTTSSKALFGMVLKLRKLQLLHGAKIHLIHVAGTRMIAQGTDGISRGNLLEGVMTGQKMLSFVPINESALTRSESLLSWIKSWTMVPELKPLKEEDWFWRGQGLGNETWKNIDGLEFPIASNETTFLWAPPPCIADVALEALRKSVHKRPHHCHIFVCPKLMTYKWRKIMLRSCDLSFYVDPGEEHWKTEMYESLLIGIYLPLLPCYPWTFRRSASVLEVERKLREVSKTKTGLQGPILRKFLSFSRSLPAMPEGVVWSLLHKGRIR